jgi:hypothetical protein
MASDDVVRQTVLEVLKEGKVVMDAAVRNNYYA